MPGNEERFFVPWQCDTLKFHFDVIALQRTPAERTDAYRGWQSSEIKSELLETKIMGKTKAALSADLIREIIGWSFAEGERRAGLGWS